MALKDLLRVKEFAWPFSWPLTNDSRANLMIFYKSISIYILSGPEVGTGVEVGVKAQEMAGIGVRVSLHLVEASLASLSLPAKERLKQSL